MLLASLIGKYPIISIHGDTEIQITGIEHNSKNVKKGNLYIAQKGHNHDGHDFIDESIRNGAVAIVKEKDIDVDIDDVRVIDVKDSSDALGYFAAKFYHQPWTSMNTIGITGTNGKTTTSYLLKHILEIKQQKVGIIGTMGVIVDKEHIDIPNTTPDSLEIQKNLNKMMEAGLDSCIMEVSSHALDMKRVKYMDFDIGIFTNLSKDHLDYHKTMENYFQSKLKLFLKSSKLNIINKDDIYGQRIINQLTSKAETITYGLRDNAHIYASDIEYIKSKPRFKLNTPKGSAWIELKIPGEFNIYNSLAAAASCFGLGLDISIIKEGLETFQGVKGRFEEIETNADFSVIIDFAHTPEGIREALKAIDKFAQGRKIIVFGAGGDRDRSKRPEMGKIAGENSDLLIITSDNPRSEEPEDIANDILQGVKETSCEYIVIIDRKEAIKYAIMNSVAKDTILISGKGHENTITIKGQKIPFDEREIVENILTRFSL